MRLKWLCTRRSGSVTSDVSGDEMTSSDSLYALGNKNRVPHILCSALQQRTTTVHGVVAVDSLAKSVLTIAAGQHHTISGNSSISLRKPQETLPQSCGYCCVEVYFSEYSAHTTPTTNPIPELATMAVLYYTKHYLFIYGAFCSSLEQLRLRAFVRA